MQRFSDIGITPGNTPAANAGLLRAWAGAGKALMIDQSSTPYKFDTGGVPIQLAYNKLAMIAESPNGAILQHVAGAGDFLSFNGQATAPSADGVKRIIFGEEGREIEVRGAVGAGTASLVYAGKLADCQFNVRVRDADTLFRVDIIGQTNPSTAIGAVECRFNITSAPDWDEEAFVVGSRYGVLMQGAYNNQCRLNIEGNGILNGAVVPGANYAIYFNNSNRNDIAAGSSAESNGAGGTWFTSTCVANTCSTTDNEWNANAPTPSQSTYFDWVFRGVRHVCTNIAGMAEINGYSNTFVGCDLTKSVVNNLGTNSKHSFLSCDLVGWNDVGNLSWVRNSTVPDKN